VIGMTKDLDERIAALEERLRQAKERKKMIERRRRAIEAKRRRSEDTRRKILVGSIVLAKTEKGEMRPIVDREGLLALLDEELTRDDDRALFGLPPKSSQAVT
jgi:large subunit ribosomal protein L7/L12